jgi:hypothetical protein
MQAHDTPPGSWPIHEAIAVAFSEFAARFGEDVLWHAFSELTENRDAVLAQQAELASELDS